jgi:putative ABC transport system ATP-binding protein
MLRVEAVQFSYGDGGFCLRVPHLAGEAGECLALIGPSGSGKTTFFHLVAGIRQPGSGTIELEGRRLARLSPAARRQYRLQRIGLVFQEFELLEYLHVLDNILIPCRLDRSSPLTRERRERAIQLARDVGLDDKLTRLPHALSQGERQRVALCRALVLEPPLVLADEPTGNLDPVNKQHVLDLLVNYARRRQALLMVATHDHQLLPRFDRVVDVMDWGEEKVESRKKKVESRKRK